jgi:hypothetical protein
MAGAATVKGQRCDTKKHRALGHTDGEWEWVSALFCWRKLCMDCGKLVATAEGSHPLDGE